MAKNFSDLTEIFNTNIESVIPIYDSLRTSGDRLCSINLENLEKLLQNIENGILLPNSSVGFEVRIPEPVIDLALNNPTSTGGQLTWTLPSSNGSNIISQTIERSLSGQNNWLLVSSSIGNNITNFTDSAAIPNTQYDYRHFSTNSKGNSAYSNIVTITTLL